MRRWLDFGKVKSSDALELLQSKDILSFHPVSSVVNNSRNNTPECLQPVDPNSKKVRNNNLTAAGTRNCTAGFVEQDGRFQLTYLTLDFQGPKPTASNKMMMSWLSSSSPSKRKASDMGNKEQDSKAGTQRKSKGALQQWLQGASKKQKTK